MRRALVECPGDTEFCIRYALAVIKDEPDDALDHVRKAASLSGGDPGSLARCAAIMYDLGEYEDARRYVRQLIPLADDDFALMTDVVHLIGKLAAEKGNHEVAERYLTEAFEAGPGAQGHARHLAQFLMSQGRSREALDVVTAALTQNPEDRGLLAALRAELLR
jgi:Flp pilus assembly protein TadD